MLVVRAGVGVSRNDKLAARYFRKAARRKDTDAMLNLANMYQVQCTACPKYTAARGISQRLR